MTDSLQERWDQRFTQHAWPAEPDPLLVELAEPLPPGRGLDLGAGPGRNSIWLAAKGWEMTLVDVSIVGLDQAVAAADALDTTITTVQADVSAWQPEEAGFDLVIIAHLHPGPDALAALLASASRALRPGGHLYVVGHHVANLGRHGPSDPDRLLTADRLRSALPADLAIEVLDTRHRTADHGRADHRRTDHSQTGHPPPNDTVVLAWATKPSTPGGQR